MLPFQTREEVASMNALFQRLVDASGPRANLVVRLLDSWLSRRRGPVEG